MAEVFTNQGRNWVADRLRNAGIAPSTVNPEWIGWGTGAGTAAATDTTLFTEATEARTQGTMSNVTVTTTGDTFQVVGSLTATGTKTITNAGVFDTSTAGDLILKADHAGVPLLANDSIQYTFKLTFS